MVHCLNTNVTIKLLASDQQNFVWPVVSSYKVIRSFIEFSKLHIVAYRPITVVMGPKENTVIRNVR